MRKLLQIIFDWIDRYVAVFVVIGMLFLTGLGIVVWRLVEEVKATAHNQLVNRATNVESWCGGINQGRDYDRTFVGGFHLHYALGDKDCEALVRKTLESPKGKGPITAKSNPLVFRVLHAQSERSATNPGP